MLYNERIFRIVGAICGGVSCASLLLFLYWMTTDEARALSSGIVPVLMLASFGSCLINIVFVGSEPKIKNKRKSKR